MTLTAAEIMNLCGAGNSVRISPDGSVTVRPVALARAPMTPAEKQRAYRERAKTVTLKVTPEPETVTFVTALPSNNESPPSPSLPPSPPQVSPLHPPSSPSAPTHAPPPPFAGGDGELFQTVAVAIPVPKKRKPRTSPPSEADPRHHEITSQIGELYADAMGERPAFNGQFFKALANFLKTWKDGTADEWLDRYWDVLTLGKEKFAPICRRAADPEFLCRNWQSVAAEVQKLRAEQSQVFKPKPKLPFQNR